MKHVGNYELINLPKTAFLCSRRVPASIVLRCYDWAKNERDGNRCTMSGFHSQIERDVFHYLLRGKQPIIVALARGLKQRLEPELAKEIQKNRLLIITPFESGVTRVTQETANGRNNLMAELADQIVVA